MMVVGMGSMSHDLVHATDTILNILLDMNGSISSKTLLAGRRDNCMEIPQFHFWLLPLSQWKNLEDLEVLDSSFPVYPFLSWVVFALSTTGFFIKRTLQSASLFSSCSALSDGKFCVACVCALPILCKILFCSTSSPTSEDGGAVVDTQNPSMQRYFDAGWRLILPGAFVC